MVYFCVAFSFHGYWFCFFLLYRLLCLRLFCFFFCVCLVFEITGSLLRNTGFCGLLALRSVKHRLLKSPHTATRSSRPCLSFSCISLPSNRPDRLIIFLLRPKFRLFPPPPQPNRLQLLIPSFLLLWGHSIVFVALRFQGAWSGCVD
jgi:hypothetical protein